MTMDKVTTTRAALGQIGAFLPVWPHNPPPIHRQREAATRLEKAGYSAAWTNEVVGKDALVQLSVLLAATTHMTMGSCIANIWARPPQTAHSAAEQLALAHPGRLVLGLGVGNPAQAQSVGREFGRPVATMRTYLEGMDAAVQPSGAVPSYSRIVAANGPGLLALARDAADGALPAGMTSEFTAIARKALGADKLLVVYIDSTDDTTDVAAAVAQHLAAGADHVIAGCPIGTEFEVTIAHLERLAPEVLNGH